MDSIFFEFLKSFPSAAAIIYVVILFLRSLDKRDQNFVTIAREHNEALKAVSDKIEENYSKIIDRNTNALVDVLGTIERCKMKSGSQ